MRIARSKWFVPLGAAAIGGLTYLLAAVVLRLRG
jgi:hypothetical protein